MKISIFTGEDIYQSIVDKYKVIDEYVDALESVKNNQLAEMILKKELMKIEDELQTLKDKKYTL